MPLKRIVSVPKDLISDHRRTFHIVKFYEVVGSHYCEPIRALSEGIQLVVIMGNWCQLTE
uniref:Uncharacterized protein n=1 Tax=Salix viminalis TaxID=40686 RepID=A0A6N2KHI5_SALVM